MQCQCQAGAITEGQAKAFGEWPQHPRTTGLRIIKGFDAQMKTIDCLSNPALGTACIYEFTVDFGEVHSTDHSARQHGEDTIRTLLALEQAQKS
jgi:hypothetical protein